MNKIKIFTILLLLAAFNLNLTAQNAGDNDPTFNPSDIGFGFGDGASGDVNATAIQSDGKIIIGGWFTNYNSTNHLNIARLNIDGTLDTTFNIGSGANSPINTIAIQSDGKIIIGGLFWEYNGTSINRIARLNTDGSLDTTFNVGTGVNNSVQSIAIQTDGKIIIGGKFTLFNGVSINKIARLNANGTLDTSFNVGTGLGTGSDEVISTAIQTDGKIIIGGNIWNYNGTPTNHIVRLNPNGSLDASFNVGTGTALAPEVNTITIQPDGKIIIGGAFTSFNGVSRNKIARLNANGTLDTSFNVGSGFGIGGTTNIYSSGIQTDGKIVLVGFFTSYNGVGRNRIVRLNTNGTLDASFNIGTGTGAPSTILTTTIQPDGNIIIGGDFDFYNGVPRNRIARLNTDGTLDASFSGGTGVNGAVSTTGTVSTTAIQSDGKIIIGGGFNRYNGESRNNIARLNADGTLDTSFTIGTGADVWVYSTPIQSDGKIIIGGNFQFYNGVSRNNIARLNADGTLDASFNVGTGANGTVYSAVIQSDGKIIIGGSFTTFNGTSRNRIARLNPDGSLDTSFLVGTAADSQVFTTSIQSDGKIIIGGSFGSYNGTSRKGIARLNPDGSLDTSFIIGTGFGVSYNIQTAVIQSDGKIIVGGYFASYNSVSRNNIARLDTNGTLDTTFNAGTGTNNSIYTTGIHPNGKIIIGGVFTSYNGIGRNGIVQLNTDGTLDTTFNIGTGISTGAGNNYISTITKQPDGRMIIGGSFTGYNGIGRNRIARIFNNCINSAIDTQTTCDSLTWINGVTYFANTNTPTFNIVGGAANGCDSVVTLNLTILNSATIDTRVTCDSLTWIDNVTYTSSTNTPTFTLTNINGCDSVVTLNLTINSLNASYTSTDNGSGNYTFTNTSTGSFTQTHWAFGDGTTSTLANPTHTFNANGTYVVVLTINDSTANTTCTNYYLDTLVVTGVVNPVPCAAGFVMYPDGNGNLVLVNSSTGNNLTYFWDFGDGDTSTMQFPSHTYATAGPFYLCLTVNDGASCVDTYCDSIGINGVLFNKQTGFSINVIAPPVVVGVDEQGALITDVTIYPNPTTNEFVVELTNFSPSTQINIISVEGKMVYTNSSINTNKINVDAANWSRGIYIVKITDKQSSKVVKLVKQ